jgi:N utilization substance protein B
MRKRTVARELSVITIYQLDLLDREINNADIIERFYNVLEYLQEDTKKGFEDELINFSKKLVFGILEKKEELDELISKYCVNWTIDRISNIDKSILRLAIYEIKYQDDIPKKVSINEAIDIAKKYSDHKSCRFINGLLDNFLKNEFKG